MCGISGFLAHKSQASLGSLGVSSMLDAMAHRGPDGRGRLQFFHADRVLELGHLRLSIIDLSDHASQPMSSPDARYTLAYNGEVYNYPELRRELRTLGHEFQSQSDTEVVLWSLIQWGPAALSRFNGMWALAFFDNFDGKLILARDRFGIKPLYYREDSERLAFASEIKALLKLDSKKFSVNPGAAARFINQSLLHSSSETFFDGIRELPAGHMIELRLAEKASAPLRPSQYWDIPNVYTGPTDETEAIEYIRDLLLDAVRIRLRSDVPVGILLSGGVDSSAIACATRAIAPEREDIRLLSAVAGPGYPDESPFIDMVVKHTGLPADKVTLDYGPDRAFQLLREVIRSNDEPVGGFSTVAHHLLMRQARTLGLKVVLSGQGADEAACGYRKYLGFYLKSLLFSCRADKAARVLLEFAASGTVLSQFQYADAKRYLPKLMRPAQIDVLAPGLRNIRQEEDIGLGRGGLSARQALDIAKFSVPALVHYEDRTSMAASSEIRLPFLDYRLISALVPMPARLKLRSGWTKWVIRKAGEPFMPEAIAWRKDKQGFTVPQSRWLAKELRSRVLDLLKEEWVSEELGLLCKARMRARYEAYLGGPDRNYGWKDIFNPISLELWARTFQEHLKT